MARPKSELGDIRTSARNVRLLRWLRRKPQPAKLLGETADGEEVTCKVSQTGPAQWTDVLGVLRHCEKIKALDKDDEVLRVIELDPDDPELRAESEMEHALANVSRMQHGSVPIISVDIPKLVDNLARNMREVASEAARQQSHAFKDGFGAMTSVVNLCLQLLVRMDQRLAQTEDTLDAVQTTHAPPEEQDPRAKMAMAALKQAMGGASNGTGGMDPAKLMELFQSMQQHQQSEGDA